MRSIDFASIVLGPFPLESPGFSGTIEVEGASEINVGQTFDIKLTLRGSRIHGVTPRDFRGD